MQKLKNTVTLLLAKTNQHKFIQKGNYTSQIGDNLNGWTILIPLPLDPENNEQWIAVNHNNEFAIVIPTKNGECSLITIIDDPIYFIKEVKPHLGIMRSFMPKIFTSTEFEELCKKYNAKTITITENKCIAIWNCNCNEMHICYGRLLERIPQVNCCTFIDKTIQITNLE